MAIITRLVAGKKNPNRVNLYLDGIFAFALSLDEVVKNGLKKGLELTADQLISLKRTDDLNWVYTKLLNYLSYRPHSEFEVRSRLKKYDVTDNASVAWVINKLKAQGYLDDTAFAKWFVESRARHRPRSNLHLTAELLSKGLSASVIKAVLSVNDEAASLDKLIAQKASLPYPKLLAFLLRRGFKYPLIQAKLDELGIKG